MTEEELEVELIPKNQLSLMVADLPQEKSSVLMGKFANFFVDVQVWEKKAKAIVVKDETQKAIMDQARQGRLFIRKIRLDVEKCRKELKEESLREGKAIDKVARFLSDALEPIETHLDKQEHFVEYREAEKEAIIQAEVERKMEEDRLAEEKRKAEELEVTRRENERLKKEAEASEAKANAIKKEQEEHIRKIREENEKKIAEERKKTLALENQLRINRIAEMKAEADEIRKAQQLKTASDVVKMQKFYDDLMAIEFPECVSTSAKRIIYDIKSHVGIAVMETRKYIQSQQLNEEEI